MRSTRAQSSAARRVRGRPSRVTRSEAPHGPAAPAPGSIETQPPSGSRTEARLRRPSGDHSSALRAEPWRSCSPAGRPAASRRIRVASAATGRMIQCRGGDDVTMAADDVVWRSAVECAALIRRKELSPVELTEAVLARIDAVNPHLNAFCLVAHDVARRLAREAEIAVMKGEPLGLLHGVPVSVKDVLFTRGMRTTGGSRLYADLIPEHDAVSVGRLKAAGAVLLGKTTTSEFGHKAVTESPLFGVTRNPWNLERTPGGSSGGAAAAEFESLGCHVEVVNPGWENLEEAFTTLIAAQFYAAWSDELPAAEERLDPTLVKFIRRGGSITARDYLRARARVAEYWEEV